MDRKISKRIIKQRLKKRIIKISIGVIGVVTAFVSLTNFLKPSISIDDITVSTVGEGALFVSISASGRVVPLYEEVITSPISSKIVSVFKRPGDSLLAGDSILELDLESFSADVEKQQNDLELNQLKLGQFKLTIQHALDDTEMQIEIDNMKIERMKVLLSNERYLDSIGSSTPNKVKQIELEYEVELMQFEQLKQKFENQKLNANIDIKTKELDYKVAQKEATLLNKKMREASVSSPRDATLTWVNDQLGASISVGTQLAIVSDLNNYKIEGELTDSYSDKISPGNRVEFKLAGELLSGTVGNIAPSVVAGLIKFTVTIYESDHEKLRSGLQLDLHIINSVRENVFRIDNYSYYVGGGEYELWVIDGDKATKRKITLGESSFDEVEVVSGLESGDIVIISDMSRYNDQYTIDVDL